MQVTFSGWDTSWSRCYFSKQAVMVDISQFVAAMHFSSLGVFVAILRMGKPSSW